MLSGTLSLPIVYILYSSLPRVVNLYFLKGRAEIWQVLKAVCEVGTDEEKRTYLDAANLTIPTGDLTKGCFDELGNECIFKLFPSVVLITLQI